MNKFTMTKREVEKLAKLLEIVPSSHYTIIQDNSSGIGVTTTVVVEFDENFTGKFDITDVESW